MTNSFQNCISEICGLELSTSATGNVKYSVFGGKIAVVEGHGGIEEYSLSEVSFRCGKKILAVCGENLKLKCLESHFAVVEGEISAVKYE